MIDTGVDEYNNPAMVMKYIKGAIGLPLILLIDKSGNTKWYVDAEFTMRKDMSSHTGIFMTMLTIGAYV